MSDNDFFDMLRRSQLLDEEQLSKFLCEVATDRKHYFLADAHQLSDAMI